MTENINDPSTKKHGNESPNNQIGKDIEKSIIEREKKLLVTLLALVIVFLICNSCFLAKQILRLLKSTFAYAGRANRMLLTFNASVNAVVYCMSNVEFRQYYMSYIKQIRNLVAPKYGSK